MKMAHDKQREQAINPEDLAKFFVPRANAGDVEGLVALYADDAVLSIGEGKVAVGSEAIRAFYTQLLAGRPQFKSGEQRPTIPHGNIALTSSRLTNGLVTAEVAHQQPDGTWLWIIDQPALAKE
jgi:ketosteroid isomerase-like protein